MVAGNKNNNRNPLANIIKKKKGESKNIHIKKMVGWTSGQDGGVDRHTVPPYTTKRRTTTN